MSVDEARRIAFNSRELLEVRKFKGKMFPKFAGSEDYGLAERVIEIFRAARGRSTEPS